MSKTQSITRRSIIATAAALPVAAVPAVASASADAEVFRLAERCHAAINYRELVHEGEEDPDDELSGASCTAEIEALEALAAVPAFTLPGILAKARVLSRDADCGFDYFPWQDVARSLLDDLVAFEAQS